MSDVMSFAQETKSALVKLSEAMKHDCCRRAALYGILYGAGIFTRERIKLITTCEELARLAVKWLHDQHAIESNLYVTERKNSDADERSSFKLTVASKKDLERLFYNLRYDEGQAAAEIRTEMLRCANCKAAFIRGVFLSAGTLTDPEKGYHLETDFLDTWACTNFAALLILEGLEPKRMTRKNEEVLYYKDSESIENFLAFIGASNAAFTIMNKKIEREIRAGMNRVTNGEVANIEKTTKAAGAQIAAIRALKASGEIERMPDELKITANLRLEYPEASLPQLAAKHEPPITKSGVNHRLKKILEWKS